jgi:hypothetical protein
LFWLGILWVKPLAFLRLVVGILYSFGLFRPRLAMAE